MHAPDCRRVSDRRRWVAEGNQFVGGVVRGRDCTCSAAIDGIGCVAEDLAHIGEGLGAAKRQCKAPAAASHTDIVDTHKPVESRFELRCGDGRRQRGCDLAVVSQSPSPAARIGERNGLDLGKDTAGYRGGIEARGGRVHIR